MKPLVLILSGIVFLVTGINHQLSFAQEPAVPKVESESADLDQLSQAMDSGDWSKIISLADPNGQKNLPDFSDKELYGLGMAYLNLENSKTARPYPEEHLKRNPNSLPTIELLAEVAFRRRDTKSIEKYLEMAPGNVNVLISASKRFENMGMDALNKELPETHREFSTLRNFKPGRSPARKHFAKAEAYLRQALVVEPNSFEANLRMARFQRSRSNLNESVKFYLKANEINPLSQDHYFRLAQIYQRLGQLENAFDCINMAIKAKPQMYPELLMLRADIYSGLGRYDKATEDLRMVWAKDNNHKTVRGDLGEAAYRDKNYPLAIFALHESYRTDGRIGALAKLATCVFELEQDEMAIAYVDKAYEKAKSRNANFVMPSGWHFTRGRAYWNVGSKKKAATDLLAAYQKDPDNEEKAEWALYAFKELKDPHGLIEIARLWGTNIDAAEAFAIFKYINSNWRFNVTVNHLGERTPGHIRQMFYATATIYEKQGMYRAAYDAWSRAYSNWSMWSGWLAVNAENHSAAARGFRVLKRSENQRTRERAAASLAFLELHDRDISAVKKNLDLLKLDYLKSSTSSIRALAELANDPAKKSSLGIYDLSGVFGYYFSRQQGHRGLVLKGLLPGSPLVDSNPMLRPGDLIVQMDGLDVDGFDRIDELHQRKSGGKPVNVIVSRDGALFEIQFDPTQAADSIAKALAKSGDQP